jgi:hypothetical protein
MARLVRVERPTREVLVTAGGAGFPSAATGGV